MDIKRILEPYKEDLLEPMMILTYLLGVDKSYLYAYLDKKVQEDVIVEFENMMNMLKEGVPIQYILNNKEFMGLDFYVEEGVLIPRNDTEILVEFLIEYINSKDMNMNVLEIGVGSGAISLSLGHYSPSAKIKGTDISKDALKVANKNLDKFKLNNVQFIEGDLFSSLENKNEKFDIIVSNPPYISKEDIKTLDKKVKDHEPILALDGGEDGLDFYRKITRESLNYLKDGGLLIYEIGYDQLEALENILESEGFKDIVSLRDYQGLDRVVMGVLREG